MLLEKIVCSLYQELLLNKCSTKLALVEKKPRHVASTMLAALIKTVNC